MTIQNINIGNIANDGTGDDLREAFRKVNENFDELVELQHFQARGVLSVGRKGRGPEPVCTAESGRVP